jgi:Leucine-rich repeat (LRR) protein
MSVVFPIHNQDKTVFRGTGLGFNFQPNLSEHTQIKTVYLNQNEIPAIYPNLLPPNIQHLSLLKNYLRADGLPTTWPRTLKTINLDHNSIYDTDIVEAWPPELEELSFDDNPLTNCPKNLPETLKILSMNGCSIKNILGLPNSLKKLDCAYNKIRNIQSLPTNLECLILSHNYLCSKYISKCRLPINLKSLYLDFNNLTFLPNNLPETLEYISAQGNKITDLPAEWPKNLQMLVLNNNKIKEFQPKWKHGQKLIQLHVRDNYLTRNLIELQEANKVSNVFQANNWNQDIHHIYAYKIQKCFHIYQLKKGLRSFARLGKVKNQLMETAYLPELVIRFNYVESLKWYEKSKLESKPLLDIV